MTKKVLLTSAALTFLSCAIAPAAWAAEAATSPADSVVSEVVITGSSLRGVAPVGSNLMTVGREDIQSSGASTTAQLIENLPQVLNLGVSESARVTNGGSANFTYAQGINIHGVGPYATLLLIDGRRVTPQGAIGQSNDISLVPTIALQRVEIVPDGASAIYGSDAVAGVANLILRRSVEGAEVVARYGAADDYHERQFGIIVGHNWGSGRGTLAYGYTSHSALQASDRDYAVANLSSRGGTDFRGTQCNPGNILIGGVSYAIPAGGVTPATAGQLVANTRNRCEVLTVADLVPKVRHQNLVGTLDQTVTNWLEISATGVASQRDYVFRNGISVSTLSVPASNAFYVRPTPGATPETVAYAFTELPTNDFSGPADYYQGSLEAKIKLPHDWRADVAYTLGYSRDLPTRTHALNAPAIAAALASSNPATALNPYGAPNSAALLAAIGNGVSSFIGKSNQGVLDLALDGPVFELPGGTVKLAVGYQHQDTKLRYTAVTGNTAAPIYTRGVDYTRHVDSAYAEILVPIVSPENAISGVRSLALDLAGRYDHYNDAGTTTNPKVGVNWEVIEGLKVHGSYGTSFRAPSIFQQKGPSTTAVVSVADPQANGANVSVLQITGSYPGLRPETATTYSLGVDFAPPKVPGLNLSVTYFDVSYKNIIAALGNNPQILNQTIYAGLGIIKRNPTSAEVAAAIAQYPLLSGVVPAVVPVILDARPRNLGALRVRGLDLVGSYRIPTDRFGDFTLSGNASYFLEYSNAPVPGAPAIDQLNKILNPLEFQGRASLGWRLDKWTALATVNYFNSYDNNLVAPAQKISSYGTVDLHADYDLGWRGKPLRIGLDVTNLFDKDPPFVNVAPSSSANGGYDATLVSPVGRLVAVTLSATF